MSEDEKLLRKSASEYLGWPEELMNRWTTQELVYQVVGTIFSKVYPVLKHREKEVISQSLSKA